jgi:quinol monooxygenase YgiN
MVVVTGRVRIPDSSRDRFVEVATEMCRLSREEEGCGGYRVYGDLEQPEHYVFVEEWADEDALQRHFAQAHTTRFLGALGGLLDGPADAVFHTTAASRRLVPGRGLVPVD